MALSIKHVAGDVFGLHVDEHRTPSFHVELGDDGNVSVAVSPNHLSDGVRVPLIGLMRMLEKAGPNLAHWWNHQVLPKVVDRGDAEAARRARARHESAVIAALSPEPTTVHGVVANSTWVDSSQVQEILDRLVKSGHVEVLEELSPTGLPLYALPA